VLLRPADQPERDRDVDGAEDGQVPQRPAITRQRRAGDDDGDHEDREADQQPQADEAERR
jgi:hypothetical protein